MKIVTLQEAQARLGELLKELQPSEEMLIQDQGRNVGRIIGTHYPPDARPIAGRGIGTMRIISEDDSHLEDFADYMS